MPSDSPIFNSAGPAVTADDIAACERFFGVEFPPSYKQWLAVQNGGVPVPSDLPYVQPGPPSMLSWTWIDWFHRVGVGSFDEMFTLQCAASGNRSLRPPGLLEIAALPAQSALLLDCRPATAGQILIKDYGACETYEDEDDHLYVLCDSIQTLLKHVTHRPKTEPYERPYPLVAPFGESPPTNAVDLLTPILVAEPYRPPTPRVSSLAPILAFVESGARLTDATVQSFEQSLGVELPSAYRNFLLRANGGCPTLSMFTLPRAKGSSGLPDRLLLLFRVVLLEGVHASREEVLVPAPEMLPPDVIPIALCRGGKFLCLYCSGPRRGEVWLKGFGSFEQWDVPAEAWSFVADDFDAFLTMLRP